MSQDSSQRAAAASAPPSAEEASAAALLVGRHVGNYVIERPLARGGMGSVFVAKHPHLGREVAIKFLDLQVSARPDLAQRFLSEARITANLHHPNIVDIFDFGELEGRPYYVMELLRGPSLRAHMRAHLRDHGRYTTAEIGPYLKQICAGLDAAHRAGVVHRDLKPGNVIVLGDAPPRLKLLDFGVAKMMSTNDAQTRSGEVIGTPSHMAPEQAMGDIHLITPKSDIYSLGVIAYEMLTGAPVFRHESSLMLMIMHVRDAVTPIRELAPDVPESVARLIEACLAKAPSARPESARVLSQQLARALRDVPGAVTRNRSEDSLSPSAAPRPVGESLAPLLGTQQTILEAPVVSCDPIPVPSPNTPASPLVPRVAEAATGIYRFEPAESPVLAASPSPAVSAVLTASPSPAVSAASSVSPARLERPSVVFLPKEGPREHAALSAAGRATLEKLLLRLQLKGDFPAFARSMGEVSQKADANSTFSAGQLGQSILKDYALTAKLLRIVNSTYANRFGGKIYSVQHAIVILGFDRIRSLALGISLFKGAASGRQSRRVSDSAIGSLISGEIARSLAGKAKVNDEEAMVCAMFRNLGRHLVVVYLPEAYDEIHTLVEREKMNVRFAAAQVLGTSFAQLGGAVAASWHLPAQVQSAIAGGAHAGSLSESDTRAIALSEFSNDLCEIVATTAKGTRADAIDELLRCHKKLLKVSPEAILALLTTVQDVFQQRYAAVLGLDAKASRFLTNVANSMAPELAEAAPAERKEARASRRTQALPPEGKPKKGTSIRVAAARGKPVVAPLLLTKSVDVKLADGPREAAEAAPGPALSPLDAQIEEIKNALAARSPVDGILARALRVWATHLGFSRLLLLIPTPNRDELIVRAGIREDLEKVVKELRIPLSVQRGATNVFRAVCETGKDVVISDAFSKAAVASVPGRYYEVFGAPGFALYGCLGRGFAPVVLLADVDLPDQLPGSERVAQLAKLRPVIARAAATRL